MGDRNSDGTTTSGKSAQREHDARQITDVVCSIVVASTLVTVDPRYRDQLTAVIITALENADSRAIEP